MNIDADLNNNLTLSLGVRAPEISVEFITLWAELRVVFRVIEISESESITESELKTKT